MRIALAGNPNSGKTTMFNGLTGRNEKVGNWAGVTVDKKESPIKKSLYDGEDELKDVLQIQKNKIIEKYGSCECKSSCHITDVINLVNMLE
jgi:ribosome-binding ATPase YchF (GTP1/OBG family)